MKFQWCVSDFFLLQTASDLTEFNNCPKPSQRGCSFLTFFFSPRCPCACGFHMCVHFETNQAAATQTHLTYCLSNPTLSGCVLVAGSYRFSADARSLRGVWRKGNGSHLWSFEEWIWVFLGSGSCPHLFLLNFLPCRCCFGLFTVPLGIRHCYGLYSKSVDGKYNWTSVNTPPIHSDKFSLSFLLISSQSAKKD